MLSGTGAQTKSAAAPGSALLFAAGKKEDAPEAYCCSADPLEMLFVFFIFLIAGWPLAWWRGSESGFMAARGQKSSRPSTDSHAGGGSTTFAFSFLVQKGGP